MFEESPFGALYIVLQLLAQLFQGIEEDLFSNVAIRIHCLDARV